MNSVKIAYMIMQVIGEMFFFTMAVITPVYFTPGYYWWTMVFILLAIASAAATTDRINSWNELGKSKP